MSVPPLRPDDRIEGALEVLRPMARLPVGADDVPALLDGLGIQAQQMDGVRALQFPFTAPVAVTPLTAWTWLVDQADMLAGAEPAGGVAAEMAGGVVSTPDPEGRHRGA